MKGGDGMDLKAAGAAEVERLAYSPAEVAAAFGLSRRAIYRAIATGELRAARVCCGSRLLVPADEARAWVDRNLTKPRAAAMSPAREASGGRVPGPLRAALAELEDAA
jgi:excisionase family DNA binding protein